MYLDTSQTPLFHGCEDSFLSETCAVHTVKITACAPFPQHRMPRPTCTQTAMESWGTIWKHGPQSDSLHALLQPSVRDVVALHLCSQPLDVLSQFLR